MATARQTRNRPPKKKQQADFLEHLTREGNVTAACEYAKYNRVRAYKDRNADTPEGKAFKAAWDEALALGIEAHEDEITRRAFCGYEKPVWHKGEQCGTETVYSDTLAMFLLKARKPDKYKDRSHIDANIVVEDAKGELARKFGLAVAGGSES